MKLRHWLTTLTLLTTLGCSSTQKEQAAEVGPRLGHNEYINLVERNTASDKKYDGFYAVFEIYATLMNTDVQTAALQKTIDTLQWPSSTAQKEREKLFQENSNSTKVFLSFFTPNRRVNDLAKGSSMWKIYLEAGGEKYEGVAKKRSTPYEALSMMFPHHSRWALAYDVTFPVPLSAIEKNDSYFVITSSLGSARLKFNPVVGSGL